MGVWATGTAGIRRGSKDEADCVKYDRTYECASSMEGKETGDFAGEKSEMDWRRREPAGMPLMCDSRSTPAPGGTVVEVDGLDDVEEEAAVGAVVVAEKEVNWLLVEASVPRRSLGILAIRSSTDSEEGGGGASTRAREDERSLFLPPRGGGGGGAAAAADGATVLEVLEVFDFEAFDFEAFDFDFEAFDFERNFATTRRGGVEAEVERRRTPSGSVSTRCTVSIKRRLE